MRFGPPVQHWQPPGQRSGAGDQLARLSITGGFIVAADGRTPADIVQGLPAVRSAGLAELIATPAPFGVAGRYIEDGAGRGIAYRTGAPSSRSFTFMARVRVNAAPGAPGVLCRTDTSSLTAAGGPFGTTIPLWRNGTTFDMRVAGTDYTGAGTWNLGQWYDIEIVGTGSACVLYVDGAVVINGAAATSASIQDWFGIGDAAGGGMETGGIDFGYVLWSSMAIDARTRAEIRRTPWQLFEPERRIWVPVSVGGSFSAAAGIGTETDTAQALGISLGLGRANETDSALALGFSLSGSAGLAIETDTARALSGVQSRALGLATETDTALALSASSGASSPVGRATETDTALARAATQSLAVGLATETDTAFVPGVTASEPVGGYYEDAPKPKRKKLTVLHKDDRAEKEAEFEALLAKVSGQAQAKAKEAASKPVEITKPPRMPEIRGVESFYLRQYLPDLIGAFDQAFQAAYQAEKQAQIDAMAQAQAAIAKAKFEAEEEEIALLAVLL